jgi:hypothetical protein
MEIRGELRELRKLWGGFWSSRVLLTANNFRIFDCLKVPRTSGELAKMLKTDARATEILLDAATGAQLQSPSLVDSDIYRYEKICAGLLFRGGIFYSIGIKLLEVRCGNYNG